MENTLNINCNSTKTCLKYRRSHSIGFPVSVDRMFWNHVRSNIKTENILTAVDNEKQKRISNISSEFISLYSPQKPHSIRRKSMDFKDRDQKITAPIMHTFEQCCNYEEDKSLKIKLNALKELQGSDERRLNKLISENKVMKNKLDNLNHTNVQTNNELKYLRNMNDRLQYRNKYFSDKYETMKAIYEENMEKMNKIITISELLIKIENFELNIFRLHEDISSIQNDHDIAKDQYNKIMCNMQKENEKLSTETHDLINGYSSDLNYLNNLKKKLCVMNNDQIQYSQQNEHLKLRYNEVKNELDNINKTFCCKKKPFSVILLNIFLYILFY